MLAHIVVSTGFLVLGGLLFTLALAALAFPGSFDGAISYGRVRPAALAAAMVGWLVISLTGAVYYVLPRLTGARLRRTALARAGMWATALVTLIGVGLSLGGLGDGIEPLGWPVWLDALLLVAFLIPLVVTIDTVRARVERGVYVSLWFVMAGVATLPILQMIATVPPARSLDRVLQSVTFTSGFSTLWVIVVGTGVVYYTAIKLSGQPLANRQLARAGFWSLAFAATWAGPVQLALGPTPDWLDGVAAVLALALPVGAVANTIAIGASLGPSWSEMRRLPSLRATMAGLWMAVAVGVATSVGAFRSAAALVGLTSYWDGVLVGSLFGVGGLLTAAWVQQAMPAVSGREAVSPALGARHVRLTAWGVGATMVLLMAAGIVTGFSWAGGAYREVYAVGDGWASLTGGTKVLVGFSVLTMLVALVGQLTMALVVFRTLTEGRAVAQEILVEREVGT